MSSAKMRVLKPKIDEINKKYPKQEDAMKKQQEDVYKRQFMTLIFSPGANGDVLIQIVSSE